MIYGIIPVGGQGTRLGLPYPKELLPLKGYDHYYPVCSLTVDNMLKSGCEKIIFVHGKKIKDEIKDFYKNNNFIHIQNYGERQCEVFSAVCNFISSSDNADFLYGLPDSYYDVNLFDEMLKLNGLVCGLYKVEDDSVVGRINIKTNKFEKSIKKSNLTNYCWGVLKFNYKILESFFNHINTNPNFEAEELLNTNNFSILFGNDYYDLGTWKNLNMYWNSR